MPKRCSRRRHPILLARPLGWTNWLPLPTTRNCNSSPTAPKSDEQVFELISGVVRTALPEAGKNFLRLVIENRRLSALPVVAQQYRALMNAQAGTADAVVYSAFPIDASALADLSSTLEKRFARKLNVSVELEPALIGGIRVVVGDEVLDTSVKARLEQMKSALTA